MKVLSHVETQQIYDQIGRKFDAMPYYEDRATDELARCGSFGAAGSVFEFGCGTGRFAGRLLRNHLPDTASYRAVDQSSTMVGVARTDLEPFCDRVEVEQSDGGAPCQEPSGSFDRFVSTFVFDLLSEEDITGVLEQAHRMLRPSGLLCLASLSTGSTPVSRLSARVWALVHRLRPTLVLGCRPIDLAPFLPDSDWTIIHHVHLTPLGLPAEVVVAERR